MTNKENPGHMFLIRGRQSQPDLLQPGAEAVVDLGHEVLAGTVVTRSEQTFQFRPWGRSELTLAIERVVAVPMPDHSLADRSAAIERQRAGHSAASHTCESTPALRPNRVAMPIDPTLANRSRG